MYAKRADDIAVPTDSFNKLTCGVAVWKPHNDIRKSDSRLFLLRVHKQATPFFKYSLTLSTADNIIA